jgi:phage tail-like protein
MASQDPVILTAHNFYLKLSLDGSVDSVDGIFLECQGFNYQQEVIEFHEVSPGRWGKANKGKVLHTKLPGNSQSGNLTLRRGMTTSKALWNWFELVESGQWSKQRKNAMLTIYEDKKPSAIFELAAAWPSNYRISDVLAGAQEIEIEEVEVAYEGFKRVQ